MPMNITVGQIYRHKTVQKGGPSITPQPVNRHIVVKVSDQRVVTQADAPGHGSVDRDRRSFEEQFELIA